MNYLKIDRIQRLLETVFISRNMIYFKNIDSTNTFASGLIREDLKKEKALHTERHRGTVIFAETQHSGLGRLKKRWHSPPGGLWFTIILNPLSINPEIKLNCLSKITLITASVIAESLADIELNSYNEKVNTGLNNSPDKKDSGSNARFNKKNAVLNTGLNSCMDTGLKIKWPNDIYYSGKKLAGILSESEKICGHVFLLIGIGINVNFKTETVMSDDINAISLLDILGKQVDREMLFARILNLFEVKYNYFIKTGDFKSIFKPVEKLLVV
ncbi:MAG: biotin--[acetyl-CoA-carboxylase] ligase [Actinobacteria bacterium]|nr:biotin--[acetyl-CoA-carboxylase] ligase [Actinomycetota bacterium]